MKKVMLASLFLFCSVLLFPQNNANEILNKLQQKFNSISDLTADFKQSAVTADNKGGMAGKFFYKKKDKFRIELKSIVIAGDGKSTWNYNVKQKKYIVNNFDPNDPTNLSLDRFVYDYPSKCKVTIQGTETIGGSECSVIVLNPKKNDLNFKTAKLWKDNQDLIKKILFEDPNGTIITVELSNLRLNQKLSDSKFTMTPPEGSKVIDLR